MKQINNYIIEKLKINKDTKSSDVFDICVELCEVENNDDGQKAIKGLLNRMKDDINSIDDLYIFTTSEWINKLNSNQKQYITVDNEEARHMLSVDYHIRQYWLDHDKTYDFYEIYHTIKDIDITCCFAFHYGGNSKNNYTIYFKDKHLT